MKPQPHLTSRDWGDIVSSLKSAADEMMQEAAKLTGGPGEASATILRDRADRLRSLAARIEGKVPTTAV